MPKVLITGGAGFIGSQVGQALLNDPEGRYNVILSDIVEPSVPKNVKWPQNCTCVQVDLCENPSAVVSPDLDVAYILHGIMSSGAEANFELGMKVNFDSTRLLLDALRVARPGIQVLYTSSQGVYGGTFREPIDESARATPENSYGGQKMMCEYLINDYHRRGFVRALMFRLPTIAVRAGKPTAAASSFISGMIREPMQGIPCAIPIRDRGFRHWVCSPRTLVHNLIYAMGLPDDAMPRYDRVLNLPGVGITIQSMLDALAEVGGRDKLQYITEEEDPEAARIMNSWPGTFDNSLPLSLGFARDESAVSIVRIFKEELDASLAG